MTLPYRDTNVQVAGDSYIFSSPSSPNAPALSIDRPTGDIRLSDASLLGGKRVSRVSSIAGILGMIQLRLDKYIIVITKAQPVGRLKGHMVYKVISTDFLPLRERQVTDPDEDRFLALLRSFLKSGPMYFSYSIDLTNSFQRQSQQDTSGPLWSRADDRFFWNRFVQSDLINFRNHGGRGQPGPQPGIDPYILPVIFGVLEITPTTFKGTPLTVVLISRRSRHRAGTRYFTRGLDDEGHAANYNETEQIVILNDSGGGLGGFAGTNDMQSGKRGAEGKEMQILSYVQTRGSVPAFWAEVNTLKYTPKVQIRSVEAAYPAAKAHFDEQIRLYGDNYLVNLVNQKGREMRVKQAYEQMVEKLVSAPKEDREADSRTDEKFHTIESTQRRSQYDRLHYIYFDYHAETKGMQMHRTQLLIDRLRDALIAQQYFRAVDMPASRINGGLEVRNLQTSVVRTNCMDCLDRTNVVQSMLARWTLDRMFVDLGLMAKGSSFAAEDAAFEFMFRNLWPEGTTLPSSGVGRTFPCCFAPFLVMLPCWRRSSITSRPKVVLVVVVILLLLCGIAVLVSVNLWNRALPPPLVPPPPFLLLQDYLPPYLPPWLQDYIRWHGQPDTPDDQYVVWFCDNGRSGGIGDRARGLVSAFYLAVALGRKFRIVNSHPVDLMHVLWPAYIDWYHDADALIKSARQLSWLNEFNPEVYCIANFEFDHHRVLALRTNLVLWDTIMNGPRFAHLLERKKIPSGEWRHGREELLFTWAWTALMKPSEALRHELGQLRQHVGLPDDGHYVAIHIRRGGHWSDETRHADVQPFADCLGNVTEVIGPLPVYVATDDVPTRAEFARLAPLPVRYDDAEPFHVAQSASSQAVTLNLRTWAEFYLLMESACVVASRSGFSEWAVAGSRDMRHGGSRCHARFDRCSVEMVRRSQNELVPLFEGWHGLREDGGAHFNTVSKLTVLTS